MNWDIHLYDRVTQTTTTKVLFVPDTESRADVRLAYRHAVKTYKLPEDVMLAVPHNSSGKCSSTCRCNQQERQESSLSHYNTRYRT